MDSVGLRDPMRLSYDVIDTDPFYPWVKPTDFVKAMNDYRRLDLLLPCKTINESMPVLADYWDRFCSQFPDHDATKMSLAERQMTIPLRIHGDEGRSRLAHKTA